MTSPPTASVDVTSAVAAKAQTRTWYSMPPTDNGWIVNGTGASALGIAGHLWFFREAVARDEPFGQWTCFLVGFSMIYSGLFMTGRGTLRFWAKLPPIGPDTWQPILNGVIFFILSLYAWVIVFPFGPFTELSRVASGLFLIAGGSFFVVASKRLGRW